MTNRREFFVSGALAIYFGGICACHGANIYRGCGISAAAAKNFLVSEDGGIADTALRTGNRDFDYASAQTLAKISDIFNVLPGFGYFKRGPANAFAIPQALLRNPDGTVLFGKELLFQVMDFAEGPEAAFAGICAHEFGHIVQYKLGLTKILNVDGSVRNSELHADFLAGYFVGVRKRANKDFHAAVVADTFAKLGDTDFRSPIHHGTPEERGRAIVAGFQSAYRENMSFTEALERGIGFVRQI